MDQLTFIINKNSGTVLRLGEDVVEQSVRDHFGGRVAAFHMLDAKGVADALKAIAANPSGNVIVGGGDGTAVTAAEILGPANVPFGVLPLGTMNLLAQDLGSAPTFEDTLKTRAAFRHDRIDAGTVNGRLFLCSAVIGFVPEGAVVREELRENPSLPALGRFIGTIARGIGGDIKNKLHLRAEEGGKPLTLDTTALIVANNGFIKNPDDPAARFARGTLTDGRLAVYSAAPRDMMDGLRIAFSVWQGTWQDHDSVFSFETPAMIVEPDEGRKILISLDGEPVELRAPLKFSINPKSLSVLRWEHSS